MTFLTRWPRARRRVAAATAIAVLAGVPVALAIANRGFPVSDVELDARVVWVTNEERALAGRLNRQIEELTASTTAASSDFDVLQDGRDVFLHDRRGSTLERIDPSRASLVQRTDLPPEAEVALGASTLAIMGGESGEVWITDVANELSLDPSAVDPDLELGPGGRIAVTRGGTLLAASPEDGTLTTVQGFGEQPVVTELDVPDDFELSAVGETAVLLDAGADVLVTGEGRRTELGGDGIRLQQPGQANDVAIVATGGGLLRVPLDGGEIEEVPADIAPTTAAESVAAPVWLDGCAHGAWPEAQMYLMACDDREPQPIGIEQPTQGMRLEFRVNQQVIALNNLVNGNAWILDSTLRIVDNWDEVTPPEESDEEDGDEQSSRQSFEDAVAERSEENRPPVALDDEYGVRPGRTTILPVLDNDTDPDGDVLVIERFEAIPETIGRLDLIDGGRALQFTPGDATSGSATFRYTVGDGRGGRDEAAVLLRIVPPSQNSPPQSTRTAVLASEVGQQVQYNVLVDWFDPDGDDLFLETASPTSGDDVSFTPDGFVTFEHTSTQAGEKKVAVVVSDGTASETGEIVIDVQPAGSADPVATADYVETFVGETRTIQPLDNDTSPSGDELRLVGVDDVPANATVVPNLERKNIAITGVEPGTFYFTYGLAGGSRTSEGLVRVEVREDPEEGLGPVAVKDSAFLRVGETTTVRPLVNDVSPSNKVLAIQSVDTTDTDPAVSVELLNSTIVRVTASAALTEQTQFTYTVSDGTESAVAGVTVVPVPPIVKRQPPVARDDRQTVRAGDIASIDVLDNDFHPDRQSLFLDDELVQAGELGGGLAFVNDDQVRFQAPREAGEYTAVYRVHDQFGESATASVTFVVRALDGENRPPVAATQTARTFEGSAVRIDVPLDGIDPDGDSVVLSPESPTPPSLGRIVEVQADHIIYEPNPGQTGTDRFEYRIEDAQGLKADGEIVVGVIPRADQASRPNAVDDSVEVRPGRLISVPVLANDSDPNGYTLELERELAEVDPELVNVEIDGAKIIVEAPETEQTYLLQYTITNGHGGTDSAFVKIRVTADAELLPPTGQDYYVQREDVDGATPIRVPIRDVMNNPNGRDRDLLVSVDGPNAGRSTVDQEAGVVTVVPGELRHAVTYRVTDPEDETLTGEAFIIVPPLEEEETIPPPRLRDDLEQQIVEQNSRGEWNLEDIVYVPSGQPARITEPGTVLGARGLAEATGDASFFFEPDQEFRGRGSVTFEVTDGESADDPNGRKATLTLPITVGDPQFRDLPPEFTTVELQVEAGEGAETIDLRDATSHQNPALVNEVSYGGLSGATQQISGSIGGTTFTTEAAFGVQPGASATFDFTLQYREFQVPGTVRVTTVASTRPPAQAVNDEMKGQRSRPSSMNVLANDFDPFRGTGGHPLQLVDAVVENAAESAAAVDFTRDGEVTVSPNASFIGVVSVVYTVQDATDDPSRHVKGRFLLNVRDVPDRMQQPRVVEGDESVTVSWQTPATNGEPILDYTIAWNGGRTTVAASQASQTITGLTNGTDYRFTLTARNVLGVGTASPESAAARPFGAPTAPSGASIAGTGDGSGRVNLSWGQSQGNGRDIIRYEWEMTSGPAGSGSVNALAASSQGAVGTASSFRVRSVNAANLTSPWTQSGSATPQPSAPSNPRASVGADGDRQVTMTWNAANSTEGITYDININNGGWNPVGGGTTHRFQGEFDRAYSFKVRAVSGGITTSPTGDSNTVRPKDVDPPPAEARIGKGGSIGCDSGGGGCGQVRVQVRNWAPGNYQAQVELNGGSRSVAVNLSVDQNGNGSAETLRHYGIRQSGETISVLLNGRTVASVSGPGWNDIGFGGYGGWQAQ